MKTPTILKKPITFALLVASATFGLSLAACSDDSFQSEVAASANLTIVNSAEGSSAQDFYLDDVKASSSAVAYTQSSGYFQANSGTRKAEFKTSGTTTVNSSSSINLQPGKYYTVYFTGGASSSANVTTEDDRTAPSAGKAKVRFVHLSSAIASGVDFGIQSGSKIVSNLAYKSASAYSEIDPSVSLQVFAAGQANALASLGALGLQAGKVYTIYVTGSTTLTLTSKVVVNL